MKIDYNSLRAEAIRQLEAETFCQRNKPTLFVAGGFCLAIICIFLEVYL